MRNDLEEIQRKFYNDIEAIFNPTKTGPIKEVMMNNMLFTSSTFRTQLRTFVSKYIIQTSDVSVSTNLFYELILNNPALSVSNNIYMDLYININNINIF